LSQSQLKNKEVVTVRINKANKVALDEIANQMDRDRSYIINEAITEYLSARQWQVNHINQAIAMADAGDFATSQEVDNAFAQWRK
jgi:predicted transcriptional regulator